MAILQSELDELLVHRGQTFTIVGKNRNGSTSTYTGLEATAFAQDRDKRNRPHTVTDASGALVYSQDADGTMLLGNAEQLVLDMHHDKTLRAQVFVDNLKRALRFGLQGLRS